MKSFAKLLLVCSFSFGVATAAVPTEEGLLKNVNNADLQGKHITVKMLVQKLTDLETQDFVKWNMMLDASDTISLYQGIYSNGQMLNSQLKSAKYIGDLATQVRRESHEDRALFHAVMMMLTTNKQNGMQSFLEKNGVRVVKNSQLVNEDKVKLLESYKKYLATAKGRGEAGSPLSPEDPKEKEKVQELFRSNTLKRSSNIELVKKNNEFMWKVDWKVAQGFFANETRQFREIDFGTVDKQIKIEANNYLLFNGINELPKYINLKDSEGQLYKIQILGLDVKKVSKKPIDEIEEVKKELTTQSSDFSFLY